MRVVLDYIKGNDAKLYWELRRRYVAATKKSRLMYYILRKIEKRNNAEIGISYREKCALFKSQPFFPHGLNGIIISTRANIGENAVILHQVTIGTAMIKERSYEELRAPSIGDNVYIGTGAKIIGDIRVGDNCIIGANAVVVKDIPSGFTAVGNPARIFENSTHFRKDNLI